MDIYRRIITQAEILAKRDELEKQYGKTGHATFVTIGFDAAVELFLQREKILRDALERCKERLEFISSKSAADHSKYGLVFGWWESDESIGTAKQALAEVPEWK